ncbi:universal stress protein [Ancylobacter oerskovii]|uniref:Universal stress protein n=1 Tax=Ancylobacter oerskovii TaxID=459519 RepID=A0ABW4Z3A4_9HYPH|nr:universal stress protein [Ancylobacter oerskovii]MBS7546059.1 universal stress protein [Ancylobacter oerskovii]
MSLRTVLLHAAPDSGFNDRLAYAVALSKQAGARLVALYTLYPAGVPRVGRALSIYVNELKREAREKEAEVRSRFDAAVAAAALPADWSVVDGEVTSELRQAADFADVIVVSETVSGTSDDALAAILPEHLALTSTAPVVVVPTGKKVPAHIGRVAVAWKPSREAGHAVRLALPLLKAADQVLVLTVGENGAAPSESGARLTGFLKTHGVNAEHRHAEGDPTKVITAEAEAYKADLLVMGAYSRPRLTELVLGGVTASLIANPPLPLLCAH